MEDELGMSLNAQKGETIESAITSKLEDECLSNILHHTSQNSLCENKIEDNNEDNNCISTNIKIPDLVDANKIGLFPKEEAEIKHFIESPENVYMKDPNIIEKVPAINYLGNNYSSIGQREYYISCGNQAKVSDIKDSFESFKNDLKLNKRSCSVDIADNASKCGASDSFFTKQELNYDRLIHKTPRNKLVYDSKPEEKSCKRKRNTNNKERLNKPRYLLPMNDEKSPFYIDRNIFPVATYKKGLMFNRWNPTQVLYEICCICFKSRPEYVEVAHTKEKGFIFRVKVQQIYFLAEKWHSNKNIAKHEASTTALNFIGFKFNYENCRGYKFNSTSIENCNQIDNDNAIHVYNQMIYSKQIKEGTIEIDLRNKIKKENN